MGTDCGGQFGEIPVKYLWKNVGRVLTKLSLLVIIQLNNRLIVIDKNI